MAKSVFHSLYDDPKKAAVLAAKSDLALEIENLINKSCLNNTQVAELLGVPRSRVSELMNGKIDKISLDALSLPGWPFFRMDNCASALFGPDVLHEDQRAARVNMRH